MNRLKIMLLSILLIISLNACNTKSNTTKEDMDSATSDQISVDEKLLTVDITVPASFVENMTVDEIKETVEKEGYSKYVINENGSVTYTMTKAKRNEILKNYKTELDKSIEDFVNGKDKVASFKSINYNDNLSQIDILLDSSLYSTWDTMYSIVFYMSGAYYQIFDGVKTDDIDVLVNYIDNDTKEIIDSGSYKEWIKNLSSTEDSEDSTPLTIDEDTPIIK